MTMPLLEGLDGVQKMSKSLGNYVGITESPGQMFGKLMSISDELMWRYFELLSFRPLAEVGALRESVAAGRNPMEVKFELAAEIVGRFHGEAGAVEGRRDFDQRIREGGIPEDLPRVAIAGPAGIAQALTSAGLTASNSEAFRLIKGGGVRIDGERVDDRNLQLPVGAAVGLQVGKRKAARVTLVEPGAEPAPDAADRTDG